MKKILDIPYYSQIRDIKREEWQLHACGIVCVAMVLKVVFSEKDIDIDMLIDEAVSVGGHVDGKWTHGALALLARNHGLLAYSQEFRTVSVDTTQGIERPACTVSSYAELFMHHGLMKIVKKVEEGLPTVISVREGFATNNSSHNVLVVGYESSGDTVTHLYMHDPDTREYEKNNIKVSVERFFEYWRLFAIFFEVDNKPYLYKK